MSVRKTSQAGGTSRREFLGKVLKVGVAAALGGEWASRPWSASAQEPVTLLIRTGTHATPVQKALAQGGFEKEFGIKVNVVALGRHGYLEKVSTSLLSGASDIDIVTILGTSVTQFAEGGAVEPLSDYLKDRSRVAPAFHTGDLSPVALRSVTYKDRVYAMPFLAGGIFHYYRKDLIPTPPETWDEFRQIAIKFTQSHNPASPTEFGATFSGKRGETPPKHWYQYFWSFGGRFFDERGRPALNSEAGVRSLEFVVDNFRKYKIYPPDITAYEFPEISSAFQNGKVAMVNQWPAAYHTFKDPKKSPLIHDKFAMTVIPGVKQADGSIRRTPFFHTWCFAVNARSRRKEAAVKFVTWLMSKPTAKLMALVDLGIPAVSAIFTDPEVTQHREDLPTVFKSFSIALNEPTIPAWPRIHEFIDEAIALALAGQMSPKAALDEANQKAAAALKG